jgi:hypothetical protein
MYSRSFTCTLLATALLALTVLYAADWAAVDWLVAVRGLTVILVGGALLHMGLSMLDGYRAPECDDEMPTEFSQ